MLPEKIETLVSTFSNHYDDYKNTKYNEANVRGDFIDKFIHILGLDVNNDAGVAEYFREVVKEDKQKVDEHTKSPDYCIQFGSKKLFFIEAKKPSVFSLI